MHVKQTDERRGLDHSELKSKVKLRGRLHTMSGEMIPPSNRHVHRKTIEAGGSMTENASQIVAAMPIPSAADYEARLRSILGSREDPDTIESYLRSSFRS